MKRILLIVLALAIGLCPPARTDDADAPPRLVLLLSWDGLRPDAIAKAPAPNLLRLIHEGAYCPQAQTIFPSATLPSHTSMLTGLTVAKHKVLWNEYVKGLTIAAPTILDIATDAGLECAMAAGKQKFYHYVEGHKVKTYFGETPDSGGDWSAKNLTPKVIDYIKEKRPRLVFLHYRDPDSAGHKYGWMSDEQMTAVRACDEALGTLLAAIDADPEFKGKTTILVTADHGGHDKTHGSLDPIDMTIPWIAWGAAVAPGKTIETPVHTYDSAATVLYLLGLDIPAGWDGKPVLAALYPKKKQ